MHSKNIQHITIEASTCTPNTLRWYSSCQDGCMGHFCRLPGAVGKDPIVLSREGPDFRGSFVDVCL